MFKFLQIFDNYEPESSEIVEHDIVFVVAPDGTVTDFTEGDDK